MSTITFSGATSGIKNQGDERGCMDSASHWMNDSTSRSIIIVSDGAGSKSAKYSNKASHAYVENVKNFFISLGEQTNVQDLTAENLKVQILKVLNRTIDELFEEHNTEDPRLFGGTLLFVYVDRDLGVYFSGHIGDGYIIRIEKDKIQVESYPENGEQSNQTYFVPEAIVDTKHLRIKRETISENLIGFMCMSDGLDCLFPTNEELVSYYKRNHHSVPVEPDLVAVFTYTGEILPILKKQFTEFRLPNPKNKDIRRSDDDVGLGVLRFEDRLSIMEISSKIEGKRLKEGRSQQKKKKVYHPLYPHHHHFPRPQYLDLLLEQLGLKSKVQEEILEKHQREMPHLPQINYKITIQVKQITVKE